MSYSPISNRERGNVCGVAFQTSGGASFQDFSTSRCQIMARRSSSYSRRQQLQLSRPSSSSSFKTITTIRNLSTTDDTTNTPESFYAPSNEYPNFESIGIQSPILLERIQTLFSMEDTTTTTAAATSSRPSAVQSASYPIISSGKDVTIGAETGSGKTLAYLLPLLDDILLRKAKGGGLGYDYARAIILVPNKELANQVLRMAMHLCGGPESLLWSGGTSQSSYYTEEDEEAPPNSFGLRDAPPTSTTGPSSSNDIVRLGLFPGGLNLIQDYKPFRMTNLDPQNNPPLDLVVTTPASLGPLGLNPKNLDLFADVQTLVIDEADMLFDGGYIRALENVLLGFKRADRLVVSSSRSPVDDSTTTGEQGGENGEEEGAFSVRKTQHVLVAATLPDMGLKSVDAYVKKKFPYAENLTMGGMHNARHNGLRDPTVWIEDDRDDYGQVNKKRLESLLTLLQTQPDTSDIGTTNGLAGEKVMVFLNSVEDVDGSTNALRRAGINAVPFHAKIPLSDRTKHLNDFRSFVADTEGTTDIDPVVLVCTDLAARGLDVPGVTAVVQLQFAGNVVAHLHRMGRCGRAGNRDGRGIVFYGGAETELVEVVKEAEMQQEKMVGEGERCV